MPAASNGSDMNLSDASRLGDCSVAERCLNWEIASESRVEDSRFFQVPDWMVRFCASRMVVGPPGMMFHSAQIQPFRRLHAMLPDRRRVGSDGAVDTQEGTWGTARVTCMRAILNALNHKASTDRQRRALDDRLPPVSTFHHVSSNGSVLAPCMEFFMCFAAWHGLRTPLAQMCGRRHASTVHCDAEAGIRDRGLASPPCHLYTYESVHLSL